jgi:hypothetical protein
MNIYNSIQQYQVKVSDTLCYFIVIIGRPVAKWLCPITWPKPNQRDCCI